MDKRRAVTILAVSATVLCFAFMFYSVFFAPSPARERYQSYMSGESTESMKGENPENIKPFSSNDSAMNTAIQKARSTFMGAVPRSLGKSDVQVMVKLGLETDSGSKEHLWVNKVKKLKGDRFEGIVDNDPFDIAKLSYGDRIEFTPLIVSDWLIIRQGGKRDGGFTIDVEPSE